MAEERYKGLSKPRPEYAAMEQDWLLSDTLIGGTRAMREAGKQYLPKFTMEHEEDYKARLDTATLLPAYKETVEAYTGRVFAKPVNIAEETPQWLKDEVFVNVDTQGRNLHVFLKDVFRSALNRGVHYVLVDAPSVDTSNMSKAEQRQRNLRPYAFDIHPNRVLGWRQEDGVLTQARILFQVEREVGDFGVEHVKQIRVYERGSYTVYEQDSKGEWKYEEGPVPLVFDDIPLIPFYTGRTGFFEAVPPLRELAHLNIKHWNQQSSVDSLQQTACVPILVTIGLDENEDIVVGGKSAVGLPLNGDMKYVEHTGKAIESGRNGLKDLEHSMLIAGATLMKRDDTTKTATQAREEATRSNSLLASVVENFQDAAITLIERLAAYRRDSEVPNVPISLDANLDEFDWSHAKMTDLRDMYMNGVLSRATYFEEAKRRGVLHEELVWAEEQERIDGFEDL